MNRKQTNKRNIQNPSKWVGKVINPNKWNIPEDYNICRITGELMDRTDDGISFPHHAFEKQVLITLKIYVEDAEWLSQKGFDHVMNVLERNNLIDQYWFYIENHR